MRRYLPATTAWSVCHPIVLTILLVAAGAMQFRAEAQEPFAQLYQPLDVTNSAPMFLLSDAPATGVHYELLDAEQGLPAPGADLTAAELERRVSELESAMQRLDAQAQAERNKAAGRMSLGVRGHFMFDAAAFSQDAEDKQRFDEQNGLDVRVARLIVEGSGMDVMSYRAEFDYVRRVLGDLWIGVSELPLLGTIRLGYLKEPFSMEQIASRKYNTFLERSLAEAIHFPPRRLGIMAFNTTEDQRHTWAIGLFANDPGITFVQDDTFGGAVTMRTTWLPWYDEATEGRGLFHLGLAYSHRECFRHTARFQARPESFLAAYAIDTGNIPANTVDLVGTELAFVYGPFSAQSEYILGLIEPIGESQAAIQGTYVIVSYFLTGESRNYLKPQGVFGQVRPYENFFVFVLKTGRCRPAKGPGKSDTGILIWMR